MANVFFRKRGIFIIERYSDVQTIRCSDNQMFRNPKISESQNLSYNLKISESENLSKTS